MTYVILHKCTRNVSSTIKFGEVETTNYIRIISDYLLESDVAQLTKCTGQIGEEIQSYRPEHYLTFDR